MIEKPYLTDDASIWVLFFLYAAFFYTVFVVFFSRFFNRDKILLILYSGFYLLYTYIPIADFFTGIVPFFPDTVNYSSYVSGELTHSASLGYETAKIFYFILGFLVFQEPFLFLNFQIFFFFLSSCFLFKAWVKYQRKYDVKTHRIFVFLYFIYPSMLLFIPTTLRESLFILFFSILIFGLFAENKIVKVLIQCISFSSLFLLRMQLAVMAGCYIVGYKLLAKINKWYRLVIFVCSYFLATIILKFIGIPATYFKGLRMWMIESHKESGLTYGEVTWESYYDILLSLPLLSLQFLLSPLPILGDFNPWDFKALFFDVVFISILIFFFFSISGFKRYTFWTLFVISLLVVPAGYEFFFSAAARHRIPAILLLITISSEGIRNFKILGKYKFKL